MKAGRELDALVAEKVFGLEAQKDQVTRGVFAEKRHDDPFDFFIGQSNERVLKYSSDIAAAWLVVDKIDGQWKIDGQEHIGWEVSLVEASMREDRWENPFQARADTAPLAICLAALKAKGVEA